MLESIFSRPKFDQFKEKKDFQIKDTQTLI